MASEVVSISAHQAAPLMAPQSYPVRSTSVLANPEQFKLNLQAAEVFAKSDLIPNHYRGKPANCLIAINRAQRLGVDELFFMEKTFIVGGKLGMAAELAIELANGSGRFKSPIRFKLFGEGDARGCTAFADLSANGETVENTVTYAMAKADGWAKNNKWNSLRDQMLQYRAGVFLARLYAGGAMGGMYTREELEDVAAAQKPGSQVDEVRTPALPSPSNEQAKLEAPAEPEIDEDYIDRYEADLQEKLAAIETPEDLDDLWRSGVNGEVREIGIVDKTAMNRMIAAFSSTKNRLLRPADDLPPAVDDDEPAEQEQPTAKPDVISQTVLAMQEELVESFKSEPPKPAEIEIPVGEDGLTADWKEWATIAWRQLVECRKNGYGKAWAGKWLAMNAESLSNCKKADAGIAAKIEGKYAEVEKHFNDAEEAIRQEALTYFPTLSPTPDDSDEPNWVRFENALYVYLKNTANAAIARAWWKRHKPIVEQMAKAGVINDKGRTGEQAAREFIADLHKAFPELAN